MSSADSRPPNSSGHEPASASGKDSQGAPASPSLKGPPRRPVRPDTPPPKAEAAPIPAPPPAAKAEEKVAAAVPAAAQPAAEPAAEEDAQEGARPRLQPISPPSEPMQYRAIGLLRGKYVPSEESFNRGHILNHDGFETGAVLLGRATSLVRKHIDLDSEHLWVVYPRTIFQDNLGLAVQIVGVWEPETLGEDEEEQAQATPAEALDPDYFSIRGEVSKYDEGKGEITISIVQKMRAGKQPKRPFKLLVNGQIEVKTIGYFWDLHVRREANQLVMTDGSYVAAVPPKKRSKRRPMNGTGGGRRPAKRGSSAPRPKPVKSSGPKPSGEASAEPAREASTEAS